MDKNIFVVEKLEPTHRDIIDVLRIPRNTSEKRAKSREDCDIVSELGPTQTRRVVKYCDTISPSVFKKPPARVVPRIYFPHSVEFDAIQFKFP